MQRPADLRQVMKKMSRWSNPTRRRNRIPAEIILITSVASSSATRGLPFSESKCKTRKSLRNLGSQISAETVTTGSSTKNNKNLSCVGQAFQLVAMVSVEGRPGLGISGQVSHLMLWSPLGPRWLAKWDVDWSIPPTSFIDGNNDVALFSNPRA